MAGPIAEAFVRLRPDLTNFRAETEAKLAATLAGVRLAPVKIPVQAVSVGGEDVQQAARAAAAGAAAAEEATARRASATRTLAAEERNLVRAEELIAAAQAKAVATQNAAEGATSKRVAQQRIANAASAEAVAFSKAFNAALLTEDKALIDNTAELLINARATREKALADLAATKAAASHAASLRTVAKGAAISGVSMLGLRQGIIATQGPFVAGAVAAAALFKSLSAFSNLQETLNTFQAVTGATADEMDRVSDSATRLGNDLTLPGVSASDAAEAMLQLSKAGLSVEDSITGARGVLQLATAAGIENAQATELVANALNAFSLAGKDATVVADAFANSANLAQGEITDFGQAMAQVSAVSEQVGVNFNDTEAILTLLARAGLRGSDAGTSLRTAFLRLAAPTEEARDLIRALGLQIRNTQGEIRPEVFADFAQATKDLAPDVRDAIAAAVFGQDAIRAALIAGRQGLEGLQEAQEGVAKQGTAAEIAAAKNKGLAGELRAIGNQASNAATGLGERFAPAATAAADAVEILLSSFGKSAAGETPEGIPFLSPQARQNFDENQRQLEALDAAARGGGTGFQFFGTAERQAAEEAERLAGTLKASAEQLRNLGPDASGPAFDAIQQDIDTTIAKLEALGSVGLEQLRSLGSALAPTLGASLKDLSEQFTGLQIGADELPAALRRRIQQLSELGAPGQTELKFLGQQINEAMAKGIDESDASEQAARKAVADAIAAGREQVQNSIREARGNLESISSSLGDQISRIFEAAPVGAAAALDKLRESLARLQEQAERRRLTFDLGQAQRELRDARESLVRLGAAQTPQQAQARAEFLAPFIEKLKDAQAASQEFNLEKQVKQQEDLRDAAAKTAEDGLAKIVGQFENGTINATDFARRVNSLVAPALARLPKANLGFTFTQEFQRNLRTVLQQAKELAGFLGRPGTEPGPQPVNIRARVSEAEQNVLAARQKLQDQLQKNRTATSNNTAAIKTLTAAINNAVKPKAATGTRKPGDPGRQTPDLVIPTNP